MSHENLQRFEVPHIRFPENPRKIKLLDFEVYDYISPSEMDQHIKKLSDRVKLRDFDEVLVNLWGGWEIFNDLRILQGYRKWPYQCEVHRLDGGRESRIDIGIHKFLQTRKVLVIDDIYDGGRTMKEMLKFVGPESRGLVAVWKSGVKNQIPSDRVDTAVIVDDVWLGGKGMDIGFKGEKQLFRQYRGLVVKP